MEASESFDMFTDDEGEDLGKTVHINLIKTQEQILKSIMCFGTQRLSNERAKDMTRGEEIDSDEDQEIEVGDGCYVPKSLFTFKVLVLDSKSQNMVAPIMNVGSLRNCNILMHLNISQRRERIPDIPCIYLVEPTEENFKQIADDGCRNLYDYFLITFTRPIST